MKKILVIAITFGLIFFSSTASAKQMIDVDKVHPYMIKTGVTKKSSYSTIRLKYLFVGNKSLNVIKRQLGPQYKNACRSANLGSLINASVRNPKKKQLWRVGEVYINCKNR